MRIRNLLHPEIWIPSLILALLTLVFVFSDLDLNLQKLFFHNGWPIGDQQPWLGLYRYGPLPGLLLSVTALGALIGSWMYPALRRFRRAAAVVVLTLALGPGLLVNAVGKAYWGRPRPREITAFAGTQKFHCVVVPGTPGRGKSFPCGHASVGFVFMSLYFVFKNRKLKWSALGLGLAYGTLIGIGRMAQGAHFASDVLWSGGFTYLSAALAHHVILPPQEYFDRSASRTITKTPSPVSWFLLGFGVLGVTIFFLLATPFYKIWTGRLINHGPITALKLKLPALKEDIHIQHAQQTEPLLVQAELQGFGFPKLFLHGHLASEVQGTTLSAVLDLNLKGLTTERTGKIQISVRADLCLDLESEGADGDLVIGQIGQPGAFGQIRCDSRNGGIVFAPLPQARVAGPIRLTSHTGDIQLFLNEISDPGTAPWLVRSESGTVLLNMRQTQAPMQRFTVHASTHSGDLAYKAFIGPQCGLKLKYTAHAGSSGLDAKGDWQQNGNLIQGPGSAVHPLLEVDLDTDRGLLGMELCQDPSALVVPWPTPATEQSPSAIEILPPEPTATPVPPAWLEKEVGTLQETNPSLPRSPFSTPGVAHYKKKK